MGCVGFLGSFGVLIVFSSLRGGFNRLAAVLVFYPETFPKVTVSVAVGD